MLVEDGQENQNIHVDIQQCCPEAAAIVELRLLLTDV